MAKKDDERGRQGITRRSFLQIMGAGAVVSASVTGADAKPAASITEPGEMAKIRLCAIQKMTKILKKRLRTAHPFSSA